MVDDLFNFPDHGISGVFSDEYWYQKLSNSDKAVFNELDEKSRSASENGYIETSLFYYQKMKELRGLGQKNLLSVLREEIAFLKKMDKEELTQRKENIENRKRDYPQTDPTIGLSIIPIGFGGA